MKKERVTRHVSSTFFFASVCFVCRNGYQDKGILVTLPDLVELGDALAGSVP